MRILLIHNRYLQAGGEDAVVRDELALLRAAGHEVQLYERSNEELLRRNPAAVALDSLWSRRTARELRARLQAWRPDVVHVHNIFYAISAAVFDVVAEAGLPMVQTLHNFRPLCLQASFHRAARACEDCLGRGLWRGVVHRCAQGSLGSSAVLAAGLTVQRWRGVPLRQVQCFLTLSEFSREKYVAAGWPADRLRVKPNFAPWPQVKPSQAPEGVLLVGRLSREKGLQVLADALRAAPGLPLRVLGDGPDAGLLDGTGAERLGWCTPVQVQAALASAAVVVVPSQTYEQFPRIVAEAFALGVPVMASDLGPLSSIVRPGVNGWLVAPTDALAWARALQRALSDEAERRRLAAGALREHALHYSPEAALRHLESAYAEALDLHRRSTTGDRR